MLDQASELRERMQALQPVASDASRAARRILVCGAGPRIGVSSIAANLAVELAGRGKRTMLLDGMHAADGGDCVTAARLCRVADDWPQTNLFRLAEPAIQSTSQRGAAGVVVIPSADLPAFIERPRENDRNHIAHGQERVAVDCQILDAGEGLARFAQAAAPWADDCIIVARQDDASVMQAYAIVKQFSAAIANASAARADEFPVIWLTVNQTPDAETADDVFARFARGCQRFLGIEPRQLGWLPDDLTIADAAECKAPFVLLSPRCAAARAIGSMAAELNNTALGGDRRAEDRRIDARHTDQASAAERGNVYASLPRERSESPIAARS